MKDSKSRVFDKLILLGILLVGIMLRTTGVNWDQGYHLHPDERFLTMVANAERLPSDWLHYFIPSLSQLNPYNVGFPFFVYGTFPLTIAKIIAVIFNRDTYDDFVVLGRVLSAIADSFIILYVYKIVLLWEKKYHLNRRIKLCAAFFYAVSVLPIQLSHFFAVDTFLSLFMITSLYFAMRYYLFSRMRNVVLSALFFGFAVGSKITALFILPLLLFFLLTIKVQKKQWKLFFAIFVLFILVSYASLRIADPKFFASGDFFNPTINSQFIQNLKELSAFSRKDAWYPPAVQWMSKKPILFSLTNIAFFGLGIAYFILACIGMYLSVRKRHYALWVVIFWMLAFFIYQSSRFAATMRYFIFLYPFFAIFAGFGLSYIYQNTILKKIDSVAQQPQKIQAIPLFGKRPVSRHLSYFIIVYVLMWVVVWPVSFMSIYARKHSRVIASEWIGKNIPKTAFLAEEHWDDFVPVNGGYEGTQMPVFDPDTSQKWEAINKTLERADYYVITSNRAYGSIMAVPERYPRASAFYGDLFAGALPFQRIAEFTSYPTLNLGFFKFEFPDDWSEEAFTVYDHPKVIIFKKTRPWIPLN
ncbi:MAG TPA: glycosyltransferase family 39 protein [Patescibacteria group bacterium]|nr:glycosyltransferase family 39 protein [Patescibacteria group bacterium]